MSKHGPYRLPKHPKPKRIPINGKQWNYLKSAGSIDASLDAEFGPSAKEPRFGKIAFSPKFR